MSDFQAPETPKVPIRTLTLFSAIVVGISAMVGTGVFVAWQPAFELSGTYLFVALGIAAFIAVLNAVSNARMARMFPESGGGYLYGRECIHPVAGQLAGWVFLIGKAASASAAALAIGAYVSPGNEKVTAVAAIVVVLAINLLGIRYSIVAMTILVTVVLSVLISLSVIAGVTDSTSDSILDSVTADVSVMNVLAAAGILFVAFAGYARIAVLGSEVRNARRNIPIAIAVSLAIVVLLYFVIALVLFAYPDSLLTIAPLETTATLIGYPRFLVVVAAVLAAGSALFALMAGLGRMIYSMSIGGHLPKQWGVLVGQRAVPMRADLMVAIVLVVITLTGSIGVNLAISALFILTYYMVVHAASWSRSGASRWKSMVLCRVIPGIGITANTVVVAALAGSALP
jgi:APA family basic amino acid/polyamine antiporter